MLTNLPIPYSRGLLSDCKTDESFAALIISSHILHLSGAFSVDFRLYAFNTFLPTNIYLTDLGKYLHNFNFLTVTVKIPPSKYSADGENLQAAATTAPHHNLTGEQQEGSQFRHWYCGEHMSCENQWRFFDWCKDFCWQALGHNLLKFQLIIVS